MKVLELTESSPPAHVSFIGCPAVILAGGFVKAIIWLCATAATTKVAHARRVLPSIVIVDARRSCDEGIKI